MVTLIQHYFYTIIFNLCCLRKSVCASVDSFLSAFFSRKHFMVLCFVVQCVGIRLHLCVCAQIMILSFATFSIIPVLLVRILYADAILLSSFTITTMTTTTTIIISEMTKCWNDKTDKIELKSFNHLMKTNGGDAHITSQHIYKWIESKYVYNFKLNALKYFHVLFYCWTGIGVSVCDFNRSCKTCWRCILCSCCSSRFSCTWHSGK